MTKRGYHHPKKRLDPFSKESAFSQTREEEAPPGDLEVGAGEVEDKPVKRRYCDKCGCVLRRGNRTNRCSPCGGGGVPNIG